ncbi:MAG: hypothetical protein R2855_03165 [Thermomicrobiales bacterium]
MFETRPIPIVPGVSRKARLSQLWGVGVLIGMTLLFAVYLWSSRESTAVRPVDVVTLQSPAHAGSSTIQIVPYRQEFAPDCPLDTPSSGFCLVIVDSPTPTPGSMTFT